MKALLRYCLLHTGIAKLAMRPNTAEEEKGWGEFFPPKSDFLLKKKQQAIKQKWPTLINLPKLMRG